MHEVGCAGVFNPGLEVEVFICQIVRGVRASLWKYFPKAVMALQLEIFG